MDIEENKKRFIELVQSIKRDCDKEGLIQFLKESDFFTAPASTKYHGAYEGGLCAHCLNVYDRLEAMAFNGTCYNILIEPTDGPLKYEDFEDTLKIVALFHDISKTNFYEKFFANKKVYSDSGSKSDNGGRFDWVVETSYKVRESKDRFIFGTHGQNSERIISSFIPLRTEESCAIINHHSVYDNPNLDITVIFNRYPLLTLLHIADLYATYIDERL